jgi:hypothetical protein
MTKGPAEPPPQRGQGGPEQLAFQARTSPDYTHSSARTFEIIAVGNDIVLRGPCPRCEHLMEMAHYLGQYVIKSIAPSIEAPANPATPPPTAMNAEPVVPSPDSSTVYLLCTCAADHPGRPADEIGCGAYWDLVLLEV